MLVHDWKSDVNFELSFQFVCMNSHGFLNLAPPSSNSGYIFCCSVSTPELLVVALHQALFIVSGFCLSSFIHHLLLITFLRAETTNSFFLQPYVYVNSVIPTFTYDDTPLELVTKDRKSVV